MDHATLHAITHVAARHAEDTTRDVFLRGVTQGMALVIQAVEEGRATPEWISGVRDLIALQTEFSA